MQEGPAGRERVPVRGRRRRHPTAGQTLQAGGSTLAGTSRDTGGDDRGRDRRRGLAAEFQKC